MLDAGILSHWKEVYCSSLGAVEKSDVDPAVEIRLIHDLSFSRGKSTNDLFDKSAAPVIQFEYVTALARRTQALAARHPEGKIVLLKGDVKGAFRHLMTNAAHFYRMAASIPKLKALIKDMAAPF